MPLKYFSLRGNGLSQVMVHSKACPGGGIGRRARFRSVYRKMWRFEFSPGHQDVSGNCCHHKNPLNISKHQWIFCCLMILKSERNGNQVMSLNAHNPRFGELAHLQGFADFLWCQQFHHTINLRRIRIRTADAALATQRRG